MQERESVEMTDQDEDNDFNGFETDDKKAGFIFQDVSGDFEEAIEDDNMVEVFCSDLSRTLSPMEKSPMEKSPIPIERWGKGRNS